jgi:predicted ATPase
VATEVVEAVDEVAVVEHPEAEAHPVVVEEAANPVSKAARRSSSYVSNATLHGFLPHAKI